MIYNIKHVREDRIRYVEIQFFLRGIIVFAVGGGGGCPDAFFGKFTNCIS